MLGTQTPRAVKLGGAVADPSRPAIWLGPQQCRGQLAFQESHPKERVRSRVPRELSSPLGGAVSLERCTQRCMHARRGS